MILGSQAKLQPTKACFPYLPNNLLMVLVPTLSSAWEPKGMDELLRVRLGDTGFTGDTPTYNNMNIKRWSSTVALNNVN